MRRSIVGAAVTGLVIAGGVLTAGAAGASPVHADPVTVTNPVLRGVQPIPWGVRGPVLRPLWSEDSPGPGYWNAQQRGDRRGVSFVIFNRYGGQRGILPSWLHLAPVPDRVRRELHIPRWEPAYEVQGPDTTVIFTADGKVIVS